MGLTAHPPCVLPLVEQRRPSVLADSTVISQAGTGLLECLCGSQAAGPEGTVEALGIIPVGVQQALQDVDQVGSPALLVQRMLGSSRLTQRSERAIHRQAALEADVHLLLPADNGGLLGLGPEGTVDRQVLAVVLVHPLLELLHISGFDHAGQLGRVGHRSGVGPVIVGLHVTADQLAG